MSTNRAINRHDGTSFSGWSSNVADQHPTLFELVANARTGDREAASSLFTLVYRELRRIAAGYLRNQRRSHTLTPTALVHEAYLRLAANTSPDWQDRVHLLAVAARAMRSALVDYERARRASKRGGEATRVTLDEEMVPMVSASGADLIELDDLLTKLSALDARLGQLVELRAFGGLSVVEAGQVLNLSPTTIKREWRTAKAWLQRHWGSPSRE
jgi:RNA polymerase sigma factor (TIGR02999 family)